MKNRSDKILDDVLVLQTQDAFMGLKFEWLFLDGFNVKDLEI